MVAHPVRETDKARAIKILFIYYFQSIILNLDKLPIIILLYLILTMFNITLK